MNLESNVLLEDLNEAKKVMLWATYCVSQMEYCLKKFNLVGARYWNLEYQRSVNDLKHLQFKKMNKERVVIDAKL